MEWVVGTRYESRDIYGDLQKMEMDLYDDSGDIIGSEPIFEVFERQVESNGDGTGEFLWPRQQRYDGRWFGFDAKVLSQKRAQYLDRAQFRSQYYNDPNDPDHPGISRDKFQYYDKKFLSKFEGSWFFKDHKLNVFASVDFAYSLKRKADYTAIIVIGIDRNQNIYVLDIDRFKTERISEYYEHILALHQKWDFRKLAAEVTAAQSAIVKELKESYIRPNGLYISIEEIKPTRHQGSKEERMSAVLGPKYDNQSIWHYEGGNCQTLEDELVASHPPHDDCMDALSTSISIAVAPSGLMSRDRAGVRREGNVIYNARFGGVAWS
jgi:phage terminase large subunit-like protein